MKKYISIADSTHQKKNKMLLNLVYSLKVMKKFSISLLKKVDAQVITCDKYDNYSSIIIFYDVSYFLYIHICIYISRKKRLSEDFSSECIAK